MLFSSIWRGVRAWQSCAVRPPVPSFFMTLSVRLTSDPAQVLDGARAFLISRPVEHNAILTLLQRRVEQPEPGRYWVANHEAEVVGVAFQSPLDYAVTLTPMANEVGCAVVQAIVGAGISLPGVVGEAATAARFAGQWTEVTKSGARPREGQRIYALGELRLPSTVEGTFGAATDEDVELVVRWAEQFSRDAGSPALAPEQVANRVTNGEFWLWRTDRPVSMAAMTPNMEGVVRIYGVYTPPENRQRGYAGACVGHLSALAENRGHACMLYTDLGNPVSNSVYRRLGYVAVHEVIRYDFSHTPIP